MKVRPRVLAAGFLAALTLLVLLISNDVTQASFEPELKVTLADDTPEVPSDYVVDFGVPEGQVNFAGVVSFIPLDWGVVPGDKIPIGESVGSLDAVATLGLLNSPCNQQLPVHFDFLNASLDTNDTVAYSDADNSGTPDFAEDVDGNGNFDAVDKYPDFLNRLLPDIQPIRRSAGLTPVAGLPIILQFLIFAPGTKVSDLLPNDESLGYPSVTVLNNIGDPESTPAPSPITDFCSKLTSTNNSTGTSPNGVQLFVNPQPGTYTFTTIAAGQRDADGDGFENGLDTCPFDPNEGDARIPNSGDEDFDGLDAACDPNDSDTNSDEDFDGYLNRGDNCPLDANGQETTNQEDRDLDGIGDECDKNPDQADGDNPLVTLEQEIVVGGGGAGGRPSAEACPDCYVPGESSVGAGDDGGGLGTGAVIGIIVGIAAAVIIIGGAAFVLMRRGAA